MIVQAFQWIKDLATPPVIEVNGKSYWSDNGNLIKSEIPSPVPVNTLSGIVRFMKTKTAERYPNKAIHIESPGVVNLVAEFDGEQQILLVAARYNWFNFSYERWHPVDEFIVKVQSQFVDAGHRAHILRMLGNLTSEEARTDADDGVTQIVSTRVGMVLANETKIVNPVMLAPRDSFPEIEQVERPFILRLEHMRGGEKQVTLFRADGDAWKLEANRRIYTWLSANKELAGVPIVG